MSLSNEKSFGGLLSKLNINCNKKGITDAQIEKVYIDTKNKRLKILLNTFEIIDFNLLEKIEQELKGILFEFKDINIQPIYKGEKKKTEELLNEYWNNIIFIIKKELPSSSAWIYNTECNINSDALEIKVPNDIALITIRKKEIDKVIEKVLENEFNIDINVKFKIDNKPLEIEKQHYDKKIKEEDEYVKNIKINIEKDTKGKNSNNKNDKGKKEYNSLIFGKKIGDEIIRISQIDTDINEATVEGEVFDLNWKELKGDKKLYTFNITDFSNSITVKLFANSKVQESIDNNLKEGIYVRVGGRVVFDNFLRQIIIMADAIRILNKPKREDNAKSKRVELHVHTQMSAMDGVTSFTNIAKRAKEWGHKAIAITDHGVVQSFPEGMEASKKFGIKVLYGVEGYLVNDSRTIVKNFQKQPIDCEYVVFDIETTGLSPSNDKIIEIGAVKIKNNSIIERYNQLINPQIKIPEKIIELTGITDELVHDKPSINEVLSEFYDFIGDSVLVAHNASFDVGFIKENYSRIGKTIRNPVLDTLELSRVLFPKLKKHRLNVIAKYLDIELENHHRAVDDAEATAKIFLKCLKLLKEKGIKRLEEINTFFSENHDYKSGRPYHIVIFAKNYLGLKNLYKIISESHIRYYYRRPRIPKSLLAKYREGLILGTACEAGELYKAILTNADFNEIRDIINFYDYLEIQPVENNLHLIESGLVKDTNELREINKKIVSLGDKFNKPVVATGDVHLLDPQDEAYRRILMAGQGFKDADNQAPLFFKTTEEMLNEFSYLGKDKAEEIVIKNTNIIADMIDDILPIPEGTYPPIIEGSEEELKKMTYRKAKEIYGDNLPDIVKKRLDRELNSIINNGYAVLYIIAHKLVKKSLDDGYLVGSRGSVGSSFVATMSDITEVNPLPPHYICPNCKNSEFVTDGSVGSGVDMEDKLCPKCGCKYKKDGYDIPFETFLGFEGDKEPDIDLNFAGEYQATAHKYTEELFGEGYVFRAGTIGTIAEKTAYGFVKKYLEERDMALNPAEISRLVKGCTGVKRTSGQHPGGIMVVPRNKEIYDFTPIQYPANDESSGVITTHFDYHSISGRILKLDILGHDTPSIIRMLEDLTGVNAQEIPLDDKDTMKIFTSTDTLGITPEEIDCKIGTFGIPEFGTNFVRQMLLDTKPKTFAELVRISGLSHGTDVWINNAQNLVRDGITKLSEVISTRDDIMVYLIYKGLDKKEAFTIMERVRKGKGLTEEQETYMRKHNIPEWYIESCKKIKYMFPKAHAVAYVMMSFRIAYFKVHYPEAFYATYFTTKAADFDADLIVKGKEAIKKEIKKLVEKGNNKSAKEKNLLTVLEVALEMFARGYKFQKVDLYKSDSDKFIIGRDGIIPPLKSLQGVGENAARRICEEREKGEFLSIEDLISRTKATKTVIEALRVHGCLNGMSESNQLSLFSI